MKSSCTKSKSALRRGKLDQDIVSLLGATATSQKTTGVEFLLYPRGGRHNDVQLLPSGRRKNVVLRVPETGITHVQLGKEVRLSPERAKLWERAKELVESRNKQRASVYRARTAHPDSTGTSLVEHRSHGALQREARCAIQRAKVQSISLLQRVRVVLEDEPSDAQCVQLVRELLPECVELSKVRNANFEFDRCAQCDSMLQMIMVDNVLVCPDCAARSECPDPGGMGLSITYHNFDRRPSLLVHRRLIKLKEFLKQTLVKQKSIVPNPVLVDVAERLYADGHVSSAALTYADVHHALAKLGMVKFADYCMQIYTRLKGCQPPVLTPGQEEALFVTFAALQAPFEQCKEKISSTFFSMNYVVLTLCKFLRFDNLLPAILLTTTRTRIDTQQKLLRKIFEKQGWSPFPELNELELDSLQGGKRKEGG